MNPIHFKLTRSDGHTRRITFEDLPAWHELASRLQALYDIPLASVGVSYIDNDNDEITASSNEELQDYYQTTLQTGHPVKFKVLDLSLPPVHGHDSSPALLSNSNRNTFGQGAEDLDFSEWQRLGHFDVPGYIESVSEGPHAFVETVSSDTSGLPKFQGNISETESEDDQSTVHPVPLDKGKQKASSSLGAASTTSVIEEEFSKKYPVHVLNHAQSKVPDFQEEVPSQSPPKPQGNSDDAHVDALNEDPPLPSLDPIPPSNSSATLTHDVAALLSTLTGIISTHPELSEGIRNIVHNATTGAYWQSHRASLSQAANDLQQATNNFEQEAAQRVSDAIGNFFRILHQMNEGANGNQSHSVPRPAPSFDQPFAWYQPPFGSRRPWNRRSTTGFESHLPWDPQWLNWIHPLSGTPPTGPPPPSTPPAAGPPPTSGLYPPSGPPPPPAGPPPPVGSRLPGRRIHPYGPFPPGPPPPFQPFNHPIFSQFSRPPYGGARDVPGPNFAPPSANNPPHTDHPHGQPLPRAPSPHETRRHGHRGHNGRHFHGGPPRRSSSPTANDLPPRQGPLYSNPFSSILSEVAEPPTSKPNEQQLRARLEEAKRHYKAEKEAYRQEREEPKNGKSALDPNIANSTLPGDVGTSAEGHIISKAWGSYPQLELYSANRAPRRHNTHPGHGPTAREDLNARAQTRIARRLADMGFSESSHPDLPEKIKAQMQSNRVITKEEEDDIVTNLLEGLLALASKSPIASGSNAKNQDIAEGWGDL